MEQKILVNFDINYDDAILIDDFEITYSQGPDCCQDRDKDQQLLKVKFHDNGVGWFMSIDTLGTRWSIDEPEDLLNVLKDAQARFYLSANKTEQDNGDK